eukprot:11220920-Lingulodinium_polyedra.AAC.1
MAPKWWALARTGTSTTASRQRGARRPTPSTVSGLRDRRLFVGRTDGPPAPPAERGRRRAFRWCCARVCARDHTRCTHEWRNVE